MSAPYYQDTVLRLKSYWAERGCIVQEPYDLEVGAGTMAPETFLRVLGPKPYRVAYVQPSRRPADGRYGENPNRLYKHQQLQVILKPSPADVMDQYLGSLQAIGIDLRKHDIKFEEDNWESPTLGAWGIGWQVMLERLVAFLQNVDSVYDIEWAPGFTYRQVRFADEQQFSVYNFEMADVPTLWKLFELHEAEGHRLLKIGGPVLAAYDQTLKCSHLFNLLDSRGAISVTERVGVIGRVRKLAVGVAQIWNEQEQSGAAPCAAAGSQPASEVTA